MRVKLFSAPNMAEAMRKVRSELGEEALILGNRRVAGGVEITAALEPAEIVAVAPVAPALQNPVPDPAQRQQNSLARRVSGLQYGVLDWAKPIMLVGTPGAGKTLTAAKLATRLVQMGDRPMVITADGDRAGATEQLAAFTRILDLELIVAENPLLMARVLASRHPSDKTIIDMAGFNPFEAVQRETLITYAVAADANLVWVLAAAVNAEDAATKAEIFAQLGARFMIPTKLDITRHLESVLRAAEIGAFTLTDAGIGPGIADGLIALEPQVFLSRIQPQTMTGQLA
jgi:flagellar biosynthesis protein FlhF